MKPLHAVSTLNAGPPRAPRRCCSSTPQFGNTRSGVVVPNAMKSTSFGSTSGRIERAPRGVLRQIDGGLALGRDVPALDARAIADPFVGRVHHLLEIGVGEDSGGQMGARADDSRIHQDLCASSAWAMCAVRPRSRSECRKLDRSRKRDAIRAAVAFYHDTARAPPCTRRCIGADRDLLPPVSAPGARRGPPACSSSEAENSVRSRSAIRCARAFHRLQRHVAGETIGHDHVDVAREDVVAFDEADVVEPARRRAARAPPARARAPSCPLRRCSGDRRAGAAMP